ncbi:MAG: efflux RND transporter periplasmic adaptor subunit [Flavobacteriaceae bacterium]|jgi:RND family efflux transporter MFP subunit|nr:efflux RND transporter periplasmic adaptor subunit [Flavobacteriaceae bacterium]MCB0484653.1 efflux RND transporter periplasmic adaptor subunit [Flavobacteriaceae bacterium]
MKRILIFTIPFALLISCGKKEVTDNLTDLKNEKSKIIAQIDSLNNALNIVETKLSKLDSSKKVQLVTALPAKKDIFKHYVEIQGIVKSDKNIELRPELGGTIKAIYVKEGQQVAAGQLLVQLDDSSLQNSIAELNTQLELAKTTFDRQERLWNQKIGSEMQYLQAKTQKESLENNLATLRTQARKMKIIAPFSGVVDEIFPKTGELTSPQTAVVRLINLDKMYVEAEVTEAYLPIIQKGTEAIINFPSINKEITSKISQVSNYINPENRSFKVRIDISNKDKLIKPNLLADLKLLDFSSEGIIVPSILVQQDQNGDDYVFIINQKDNENIVSKKLIKAGNEYAQQIFVSEGLTAEDTLVNSGVRLVKAGDIVKINN